jgi:histidine triad (HIT) family protein
MSVSSEQIQEIKNQLIEQINSTFPEDKKQESIDKINSMNEEQLMKFLEQNGMVKDSNTEEKNCIFCSIIKGDVPSTKIYENEKAISILEINPLSEGHTLVIPKEHSKEINEETDKFANEVKEKIKNSLNPREIILERGELFEHAIINIIPIYGDSIETERKKSNPEELNKLKDKIISQKSKNNQKQTEDNKKEDKIEELTGDTIIPKRIP